jgi:hypothetical protein
VTIAQVNGPTPPVTTPRDCENAEPCVTVKGDAVTLIVPATTMLNTCCVTTGVGTDTTDVGV